MEKKEIISCEINRIEKINKIKDYFDDGKAIVIFGKGEFANQTKDLLSAYGIEVSDFFVDDTYVENKTDLTFEQCIEKHTSIVIVLCVSNPNIISDKFSKWSNKQNVLDIFFLGYNYPAGEPFLTSSYIDNNWDNIIKVYKLLEDDLSRLTMIAFLKAKISGDDRYLQSVYNDEEVEYFSKLFHGFHDEIFVDGGAYIGDTYEEFIKCGISYEKYYAFEPDEKSFAELKKRTNKDSKVIVNEKGLYSKDGFLYFIAKGDTSSKITGKDNADIKIPITTIDNEASDATFIKLDVEGSEYEALKGAEQTIRNNYPKLAICCYHTIDDIWKLPLYILEVNSGYKLYLRQHNSQWTRDLVLYAVFDVNKE